MSDTKDVKKQTDRTGEIFQDALTENQSKPRGSVRDDTEHGLKLDPDTENVEPVAIDPPVYGETDTDPNREDQRDAHQAGSEEHV